METNEFAAIGYASQALAFALLTIVFVGQWNDSRFARYLGLGSALSALAGVVFLLQSLGYIASGPVTVLAEWARYGAWVFALAIILRGLDDTRLAEEFARRVGMPALVIATLVLAVYGNLRLGSLASSLVVSGSIVMALVLISLLEQIFRNLSPDSRSGLKYACAALLVIAVYDIIFLLSAVTSGSFANDGWAARGFVNALAVLPLALSGRKGSLEAATDFTERATFYPLSVLVTGFAIAFWLLADYYVSGYGGQWSNVAIIVLVAAIVLAASILLLSKTVRASARVLLTKTFFRYKYDYRKEWLRFIGILSESGLEHVPRTAVRAVAPIVNSPGGIVWTQQNDGDDYIPGGAWHCELPIGRTIGGNSNLIRFLRDRQWVIDLNELNDYPKRYDHLRLDSWFTDRDDFWLVVPLLIGKELLGLIVLLKPKIVPTLNFEDHDLLRTVGRHVGTHIRQAESDKRLAESSQFGTYHRLSAFLMHDLNNLIAQQSLVVKNAEKFRHDPKFVDDTIDTIANSVARMRRLMEQLSSDSKVPTSARVQVHEVLEKAVRRSKPRVPVPALRFQPDDVFLSADPERLTVVIEHLIRNAQDATDPDGAIEITTSVENGMAVIAISDSGCGMSPEFISERLFRPFDSTKSSESMGIGAYQAREYARMLGGQLEVQSQVGQGTTFSLRLPVSDEPQTDQ